MSSIAASTNSAMQGIVRASENHGKTLLSLLELEQRKQLEKDRLEAAKAESEERFELERLRIGVSQTESQERVQAMRDKYNYDNKVKVIKAVADTGIKAFNTRSDAIKLQLGTVDDERKQLTGRINAVSGAARFNPSVASTLAADKARLAALDAQSAELVKGLQKIQEEATNFTTGLQSRYESIDDEIMPTEAWGGGANGGDLPTEPGFDSDLVGALLQAPKEDEVIVPEGAPEGPYVGIIPGNTAGVMLRGVTNKLAKKAITGNPAVTAVVPAPEYTPEGPPDTTGGAPGDQGPAGDPLTTAPITPASRRAMMAGASTIDRTGLTSFMRETEKARILEEAKKPAMGVHGPETYPTSPGSTIHYDFTAAGIPLGEFKAAKIDIDTMGDKADYTLEKQNTVKAMSSATMRPFDVGAYIHEIATETVPAPEVLAQAAAAGVDPNDKEKLAAARSAFEKQILDASANMQTAIGKSLLPDAQKTAVTYPATKRYAEATRAAFDAVLKGAPVPVNNFAMHAVADVYSPRVIDRVTGESWRDMGEYNAAIAAKEAAKKAEEDRLVSAYETKWTGAARQPKVTSVLIAQRDKAKADPVDKAKANDSPFDPTPFWVPIQPYDPVDFPDGHMNYDTAEWAEGGQERFEAAVRQEYAPVSEMKMWNEIQKVTGAPDAASLKAGYKSVNLAFEVNVNKDGLPDPKGEPMRFTMDERTPAGDEFGDIYSEKLKESGAAKRVLANLVGTKDNVARRKATLYLFSKMASAYANHKINEVK